MGYLPEVIRAKRVGGFVITARFNDGTEKHVDISQRFKRLGVRDNQPRGPRLRRSSSLTNHEHETKKVQRWLRPPIILSQV